MELIHKRNEFYENLISKVNFGNMGENSKTSTKTAISDLLWIKFLTLEKTYVKPIITGKIRDFLN